MALRYNALSWMQEKGVLADVDVTSLFSPNGIELFLEPKIKLFHSYLNAYMNHGDCGRRKCSRYPHTNLADATIKEWVGAGCWTGK